MTNQVNEVLEAIRVLCDLRSVPKDMPLPVRYDGMGYYWGKNNELVADFDEGVNDGEGFRIRGWGRIQDEASQDECAKYIEEAINAYSTLRLEHLLRAVESKGRTFPHSPHEDKCFVIGEYDNQKSVEQNLNDNPELLLWVHDLLVTK